MIDRLKKVAARVFCHRAIYAAISAVYFSGCLGSPKEFVYPAITLCYAVMVVRG